MAAEEEEFDDNDDDVEGAALWVDADDDEEVVALMGMGSGGFSLGFLRNRCNRLLQLSDNNCVTLVVDERV